MWSQAFWSLCHSCQPNPTLLSHSHMLVPPGGGEVEKWQLLHDDVSHPTLAYPQSQSVPHFCNRDVGARRVLQEQRSLANCLHLPAGGHRGTQEHFKGFQKSCSQEAGSSSWKHFPDSLAAHSLSEEHLGTPPGTAPHGETL